MLQTGQMQTPKLHCGFPMLLIAAVLMFFKDTELPHSFNSKKKKKKVVQTQKYQEASAIFRCTEALQSKISKTQTTSKARKYHAGYTRGTNYKTSYL